MRLIVAAVYLVSSVGPALCETPTPAAPANRSEQIRVDLFESHRREDNYGIASFIISNTTDKPLNSVELTCWIDDDRAHGTKVLVWPSAQTIPAHEHQQFSNVNIGLVGPNSRSACEVTGSD